MSLFPTVVDMKQKIVFCRQCHRWEYITGFSGNILRTQCGKQYTGPFTVNHSIFNYGYEIVEHDRVYSIRIKSQTSSTTLRRLLESCYTLDLNKKVLYCNGKPVFENDDLNLSLCAEITNEILERMGAEYKEKFGFKPTITSGFKSLNLIIDYMLSPFNINFFKIAQHWGLNPYDPQFASLSSGDTPDAEKEMFDSLGIKPTKAVRKMYEKFPQSVICYAAAYDMGFTDANLLQKTGSIRFYAFLSYYMISFAGGMIRYDVREQLKKFVTDMLAVSNQKTVWSSIERTCEVLADPHVPNNIVTDGIRTYGLCSEQLTEREKKDILHEGFNSYTHDFLVRREAVIRREHPELTDEFNESRENIVFDLEPGFLALEYKAGDDRRRKKGKVEKGEDPYEPVPDADRYCFYVARDSFTLRTVGSEMHNCVGWGYTKSVQQRAATIVYAVYQQKYKICIEVTPDFTIRQSLGPANTPLQGDALEAYHEWCVEKRIHFTKAFSIHGAPLM
jgi:hypothetical protein